PERRRPRARPLRRHPPRPARHRRAGLARHARGRRAGSQPSSGHAERRGAWPCPAACSPATRSPPADGRPRTGSSLRAPLTPARDCEHGYVLLPLPSRSRRVLAVSSTSAQDQTRSVSAELRRNGCIAPEGACLPAPDRSSHHSRCRISCPAPSPSSAPIVGALHPEASQILGIDLQLNTRYATRMPDELTFGERIRELRKALALTQRELAERVQARLH